MEFIPKAYNVQIRKYNEISTSLGGYSEDNIKAANKVQFNNTKANGLGIAFPKGTVRTFKADEADGSLEFIGEDSINHTPKNENITLNTGNSFDIVAKKTAVSRRSYDKGGYSAEMNLTITNHKSVEAEVEVRLNGYYGDNLKVTWNAGNQGVALEKVDANNYKFRRVLKPEETFSALWTEEYRP